MNCNRFAGLGLLLFVGVFGWSVAQAQSAVTSPAGVQHIGSEGTTGSAVPSRIVEAIDETRLVRLAGNTHPAAHLSTDEGLVNAQLPMERVQLVLRRSPEQEAALEEFMAEQQDPNSANYHAWLTPAQFGKLYGPSDADMAAVTNWLQNHGFQIHLVTKGRTFIEFTGTAKQVMDTFHTEMHRYRYNGEEHIANSSDPAIPQALSPVVAGIVSLNNFFPKHQSHMGRRVLMDRKTHTFTPLDSHIPKSIGPQYGYNSGVQAEEITPYDFATIYNVLPLWNAGIDGTGMTLAISGASDIVTSDVNTFRSSFGLPATHLTTVHNGADPGLVSDSQGENTEDVEISGGVAKNAMIDLVVSGSTQTSFGGTLSDSYIVDNVDTLKAYVMSASYGGCELALGTSGNAAYNQIWQQGAAEGISEFESSGDQGAAGCQNQNTAAPNPTSYGLGVNGMASPPYVTAVGGTDFNWQLDWTKYWNSTNNSTTGATAKGYIPEMVWNATCTSQFLFDNFFVPNYSAASLEDVCNGAANVGYPDLVKITAGSGGESLCTTNDGSTFASCKGGYAKPSWQKNVTGIPADGHRDIPDVSLFASWGYPDGLNGSAYLICESSQGTNGCDYSDPSYIIYQENGGTSAASPAMAGIMTLIEQKVKSPQGLVNPILYALAAKETLSGCDASNAPLTGSTCIFYDTTYSNNSQVCATGSLNCVTNTSGDQYGILSGYNAGTGYDLATGLGSVNVTNLANAWASVGGTPSVSVGPSTLTFTSTGVGVKSQAQMVTVKNTGTGLTPVFIPADGLTISGTNYTSYGATTTCPANGTLGWNLAAGASCTISITFTPKTTGTLTATLSVYDNVSGSPQTVSLSGTVQAAGPAVTLSPASLSFVPTAEGTKTQAQVVTLKNTGSSAVSISSIAVGGTNSTSFTEVTTCGASLAAGASCMIPVAFLPATTGALSGKVTVTDNAPGSPQSVSLTGTAGAASTVTLSATSLTFPTTAPGVKTLAKAVTVTNSGTATLNLTSVALTGTNPADFVEMTTCGPTLAPSASCTIFVAFKPAAAATYKATVTIIDNGASSPQSITLTGTGS